jgi:hypothetical protein
MKGRMLSPQKTLFCFVNKAEICDYDTSEGAEF